MRKSGDPRDEEDEEAQGVIRMWLRRADEFIRRPSPGDVLGKAGGSPSHPSKPVSQGKSPNGARSASEGARRSGGSTK